MKQSNTGDEYMRITTEKMQSTLFLKIVFAILITAMPFYGAISENAGFFLMLAVLSALLGWRIYETKKIYMPKINIIAFIFFIYNLIAWLWAKDNFGHILYICELLLSVVFISLFVDYINRNNDGNLSRRILYMLSVSGALSVIVNVFIWFTYYIPLGKPYAFSGGFNSNFGFGVFMLLISGSIVFLIKKGSNRKKTLTAMLIIALFGFLMAKSIGALLLVAAIGAFYFIRNKGKKTYFALSVAQLTGFITAFVINISNSVVFRDAFKTAITQPFGVGGGAFKSSYAVYASQFYKSAKTSLMAYIASSSGIIGIAFLMLIVLYVIYSVYKNRNFMSVLISMVTFYILFSPFEGEMTSIFMWLGLMVYSQSSTNAEIAIPINRNREQKIVIVLLAVSVLSLVGAGSALIKNTADSFYENEEYMSAYSWYKASANLNFADDESARRVSVCLRKTSNAADDETEAIKYADKAIKRSKDNMANYIEKARIFEVSERYDRAISQWESIIGKAPYNDEYKHMYSKVLYKVIKKEEKGSSKTKEAYEKLINISEETKNLNVKKEINDIRDKAYEFTKGELADEGEMEP